MIKNLLLAVAFITTTLVFLKTSSSNPTPKQITLEQWNDCIHAAERKHPLDSICDNYSDKK